MAEPLLQPGIPLLHDHVVDGIGQRLGGTYDDADFLGPGDTRIDKVSLKNPHIPHAFPRSKLLGNGHPC